MFLLENNCQARDLAVSALGRTDKQDWPIRANQKIIHPPSLKIILIRFIFGLMAS